MTEIQAGSYLGWTPLSMVRPDFDVALTMLTSVISRREASAWEWMPVSSLSCERGLPQPKT